MLDGKVILITGANGGLGMSVTEAFLDAGAKVFGTSKAISSADYAHPNFAAAEAELSGDGPARELVQKVIDQWGRIDALVHLVGGFAGGQTVDETDDATLERMLDMNLRSFFRIAKAVLPHLQKQRSGTVLAIGSRTAAEPAATLGAYSASKAALVSLVRTIALENRANGISANAVLPGTMDTPANRASMPNVDPAKWVQPQQVAALLVQLTALPNVTGAVIPIYGGEL